MLSMSGDFDGECGGGDHDGFSSFVDAEVGHFDPLAAELRNHLVDGFQVFEFYIEVKIPGPCAEFPVYGFQYPKDEDDEEEGEEGTLDEADAGGQSDAGADPEARGGGEAFDFISSGHNDGAHAQKTDAADDLGPHTGEIRIGGGKSAEDEFIHNH